MNIYIYTENQKMKEKVPDGVSYFLCLSLSQAETFMACLEGVEGEKRRGGD